jgi:hypothetical protein
MEVFTQMQTCLARQVGLVIFACISALFMFVSCADRQPPKPYVITFNSELGSTPLPWNMKKWHTSISEAIDTVSNYLGIEFKDTLQVVLVPDAADAHVRRIYMSHEALDNKATVMHEVTHVVAQLSLNRFYDEGLAELMVILFQPDKENPPSVTNKLLAQHRKELISIVDLNESDLCFRSQGSSSSEFAYAEAGSFFVFLNQKYGRDAIRALQRNRGTDYRQAFGKDLPALEQEWLEMLFPAPVQSRDTVTLSPELF